MISDFLRVFQLDLLDLNTFTHNISVEWIESTLRLSSFATIRKRRLPSDQVLWLVLGMAVFRDESIQEVAREKAKYLCTGFISQDLFALSAITEARKRL